MMAHEGKELTGRQMYHLAETYARDLDGLENLPFPDFYDRVKSIPYESDDERFPGVVLEVVARPKYLLDRNVFPRLDCKKKSILIGAWATANGCPFSFLAVSELPSKEVHHVFPIINYGEGWKTADATFPDFEIGQKFPLTYFEELKR